MTRSSLKVRQLPTAEVWLAATTSLRSQQPVTTNLVGSIAEGVAAGARYGGELWLLVEDTGTVVGCAVRTAPWPVVLSPMGDDACAALGAWLGRHTDDVAALSGPAEVVAAVANGMGRAVTIRMREVVRVLVVLATPAECEGSSRPASLPDLDWLVGWFADFHAEASLPVAADEGLVRAQVGDGRLWVWENGSPVAMGGHSRVVETPGGRVGRVGPVYTPQEHRKRGYGSALTHVVTVSLASQCDRVMLFADADNSASNSIYERLGFAAVAEFVEAELA